MNSAWKRACRAWTALGLALGAAACDPANPCDPGQYADHGACYAQHPALDASADQDAAADATTRSFAGFGRACSTSDDCLADAPTCGAPMSPVCTVVNCMKLADVCPPSWTCLDISAFSPDPSITSACVKL